MLSKGFPVEHESDINYATRRGAASIRYRIRAKIAVFVCAEALSGIVFVKGLQGEKLSGSSVNIT